MAEPKAPLSERHVLIVEDEYFLASDLALTLAASGAAVVGPVATLQDAIAALDGLPVDCAVLDIGLRDESSFPIARLLRERNIPFLFATGYDRSGVSSEFEGIIVLEKPVEPAQIVEQVSLLRRAV